MPTNMPAPANPPAARPRPVTAASAARKLPIIGLVGLLIGLVAGYGAGRISTGTPIGSPTGLSKDYQAGYDAARKKVEDAHLFPPGPTQATSLYGVVKSVGTDSVVVEVMTQSLNPLDQGDVPTVRTVTVSSGTKLTKQVQKSAEDLQKEMDAFQKSLAAGSSATPPDPFKEEPATLDVIKTGDRVMLTADHDILKASAFTATAIQVQSAAPPAVPIRPIPPLTPPTTPAPAPAP